MLLIFGSLDDNKTKEEEKKNSKFKFKVNFTNSHALYCDMCMSSNKIVSFEYVLTSWMWERKKMSVCCLKWMVLFFCKKKRLAPFRFLLRTSSCIPQTQKLQVQVRYGVGLIHNNLRGLRKNVYKMLRSVVSESYRYSLESWWGAPMPIPAQFWINITTKQGRQ